MIKKERKMDANLGFMITDDEMQEIMAQKRREKILAYHRENWPVWENTRKRWVTYVPDESKPNGRRQISANELGDLEDKIVKEYEQAESPKSSTLTLRILYPEWIEWKLGQVSPQTVKRNKRDWLRYYENSPIIDKPISLIQPSELKAFVNETKRTFKMDRHQFGNFHSIIAQMFLYASEEMNYIKENTFRKAKVEWNHFSNKDVKQDEELVFLADEVQPMIDYCWKQYESNRQTVQKFVPLAIVFSFYTALRNGELSTLKFSDIHNNDLIIQRMVDDNREVVQWIKGGDRRRIKLTSEALEVIEEVKRRRLELGLPIDGFIFPVCDDPYKLYVRTKETVPKYCKELGMPIRSHHDIRRTVLSKLFADGFTVKEVMDFAGHKQSSTTLNSYIKNIFTEDEMSDRFEKALKY